VTVLNTRANALNRTYRELDRIWWRHERGPAQIYLLLVRAGILGRKGAAAA